MNKLWKPALLIAALAVMMFGMISSGAWFTATDTTSATTIQAGTLYIDAEQTVPAAIDLTKLANMAPGDVSGPVVITIQNTGSLPLYWAGDLTMSGWEEMKDVIYIDYAQMEFLGWSEPTDNFIANGVGAGAYPSWYNGLAASDPFGVISLKTFDGNNGMGTAPYEFEGALMPGNSYKLTLKFGMVGQADNSYMGKYINVGFKVDATQPKQAAITAKFPTIADPAFITSWALTQLANQGYVP